VLETLNGSTMAHNVQIDSIRFGTIEIRNVAAVVHGGSLSCDEVLVGMSVLRRLRRLVMEGDRLTLIASHRCLVAAVTAERMRRRSPITGERGSRLVATPPLLDTFLLTSSASGAMRRRLTSCLNDTLIRKPSIVRGKYLADARNSLQLRNDGQAVVNDATSPRRGQSLPPSPRQRWFGESMLSPGDGAVVLKQRG
jgi:hypothetical protein